MSFRSLVSTFVLLAVALAPVTVEAVPWEGGGGWSRESLGLRVSWQMAATGLRVDPWQRLRPSMTKEEVRNLLGAPPWTDRTLLFEFWMYEIPSALATGVVVFEGERVFSWRRPAAPGPP